MKTSVLILSSLFAVSVNATTLKCPTEVKGQKFVRFLIFDDKRFELKPDNGDSSLPHVWTLDKYTKPGLVCEYGEKREQLFKKDIQGNFGACETVESKKGSGIYDSVKCISPAEVAKNKPVALQSSACQAVTKSDLRILKKWNSILRLKGKKLSSELNKFIKKYGVLLDSGKKGSLINHEPEGPCSYYKTFGQLKDLGAKTLELDTNGQVLKQWNRTGGVVAINGDQLIAQVRFDTACEGPFSPDDLDKTWGPHSVFVKLSISPSGAIEVLGNTREENVSSSACEAKELQPSSGRCSIFKDKKSGKNRTIWYEGECT